MKDSKCVPCRLQNRLASEQNAVLPEERLAASKVEALRTLTMSKTKAGGCGGREEEMYLRAECEILQLRLMSRTFVGVGMTEIIKSRAAHSYSGPASN